MAELRKSNKGLSIHEAFTTPRQGELWLSVQGHGSQQTIAGQERSPGVKSVHPLPTLHQCPAGAAPPDPRHKPGRESLEPDQGNMSGWPDPISQRGSEELKKAM